MNLFEPNRNKKAFISDLAVGDLVDHYYRILEISKKQKKDGGFFLTLLLMDKTGRLFGKIWEKADEIQKVLQPGQIHRIKGEVIEYNQKREIRITQVRPLTKDDSDCREENYKLEAPFDTAVMFSEMMATLRTCIANPHLQQLLDLFEKIHGPAFRDHFGAQKIHHAYPGGLMAHTFALIKLVLLVAPIYDLDQELLLIGALFHDLGKIAEFNSSPLPDTTSEGGLLGHIVLGNQLFLDLQKKVKDFPELLGTKIQHLILAHHGEKEFGSPEVPKLAESYTLHMLDMLDSRIAIFNELKKNSDLGRLFSDFHSTLGTRIWLEPESKG